MDDLPPLPSPGSTWYRVADEGEVVVERIEHERVTYRYLTGHLRGQTFWRSPEEWRGGVARGRIILRHDLLNVEEGL